MSPPADVLHARTRRLWSLWDMLKEYADAFIELGQLIADAHVIFEQDQYFEERPFNNKYQSPVLNEAGYKEVKDELKRFLPFIVRLNLTTSAKTFGRCLNDDDQVPSTHKEFDFVINLLKD